MWAQSIIDPTRFAIIGLIIGVLVGALSHSLSSLYSLFMIIPSLAVGARRLHDTGRSGWWQLIALIPFIGAIILIIWFAQPSKRA